MKALVEILARNLVDNPEEVAVNVVETQDAITFELRVAQSDMGKIIGKQGRIARAVRTVVKAAAAKEGKRVNVEIL